MKIYPSFRYQLHDQRTAILVYYAVLAGMLLISLIANAFFLGNGGSVASTNGVTAVTAVFAFILSLCTFKESFLINLQHGVSRRSQFLAHLGAMGAVCAAMAVADEIYTLLLAALNSVFFSSCQANSLYEMAYCTIPTEGGFTIQASLATMLLSVVFSFFLLLAMCSLGYLVTVFMYRLHKLGKTIFWTGTPFLFIILTAQYGANPYSPVALFLTDAAALCFGALPQMILTCTFLTALFSALTWLLMRRAAIKK